MLEGLGCVGFVYKIVEITAASNDDRGGRVLGLLCVGWNRAGSNLGIHFDFFFLSKCWQLAFALDRICINTYTKNLDRGLLVFSVYVSLPQIVVVA